MAKIIEIFKYLEYLLELKPNLLKRKRTNIGQNCSETNGGRGDQLKTALACRREVLPKELQMVLLEYIH